jgi:hypothetical protein
VYFFRGGSIFDALKGSTARKRLWVYGVHVCRALCARAVNGRGKMLNKTIYAKHAVPSWNKFVSDPARVLQSDHPDGMLRVVRCKYIYPTTTKPRVGIIRNAYHINARRPLSRRTDIINVLSVSRLPPPFPLAAVCALSTRSPFVLLFTYYYVGRACSWTRLKTPGP